MVEEVQKMVITINRKNKFWRQLMKKIKKLLQCMRMHSILIHTYIHTICVRKEGIVI